MAETGGIPSVGEAVRARRLALGWSQEELAARASGAGLEVRQSDISRLERGRVALPRRARLERIAAALDLPLGELLARSGWAGAAVAFAPPAATAVPSSTQPDLAADAAAATPPHTADDRDLAGDPTDAARTSGGKVDDAADSTLHDAMERARRLRIWSQTLIRRSAATIEQANGPTRRRAAGDVDQPGG